MVSQAGCAEDDAGSAVGTALAGEREAAPGAGKAGCRQEAVDMQVSEK